MSVAQGVVMPAAAEERIERVPMSLEDYLALPEGVRAEWVDGVALMTPPPTRPHNAVGKRLVRLFDDALEGIEAVYEVGVPLVRSRRIADVALVKTLDDASFSEDLPILVVEVVSPSSRTEDRVRKLNEYLAGGIGYYLLVDQSEGTLTALRNDGDAWEPVLELDSESPKGELTVGEYGVAAFDLTTLFAF